MTATESVIAARPKTTLVSLLIVAFLCGAAAGAVGMKNYAFKVAHHEFKLSENKRVTLDRWREELSLTKDQSDQISLVLNDFDKYYDNIIAEGHERIVQVLDPAQRVKFEKLIQKAQ